MIINIIGENLMPKKKPTTILQPTNKDEKSDYTKLTDYIQSLYFKAGALSNDDIPWNTLMTQTKDLVKKYQLTYADILTILKYMVQLKNIDITDRDTLGLVPYYIDETNKYIQKYKEIKKTVSKFEFKEDIITVKPHNQVRYKRKNENFD
jgi:hypothetical protein